MKPIFIASIIGLIAGLIDIIPMIIQKLNKKDTLSAFVHYFVLGLIIPFVHWGIPAWLTGLLIAVMSALPVIIIVCSKDKKAILPILIFSLMLGAGIGWAGAKFV